MKYLFFLVLVFCFSNGFSNFESNSSEPERQTIVHNGIDREFFVYLPESYNSKKPTPLVLNFHGYGGTAYMFMYNTSFNDIADKENFIVVHPQGTLLNGRSHWNVGGWTRDSKVDDVGFVRSLIEYLEGKYTIDSNKIYASGMSNGGYFSFALACQLSDKIAAIASVTGSMTPEIAGNCNADKPIGIFQMHGTKDGVVPYGGGQGWTLSIEEVMSFWTEKLKTKTQPKVKKLRDVVKEDGSTVEKHIYSGGLEDTEVIHYKVIGGGHDWFGVRGNKDIHASKLIWDYFSEYTLDGKED